MLVTVRALHETMAPLKSIRDAPTATHHLGAAREVSRPSCAATLEVHKAAPRAMSAASRMGQKNFLRARWSLHKFLRTAGLVLVNG